MRLRTAVDARAPIGRVSQSSAARADVSCSTACGVHIRSCVDRSDLTPHLSGAGLPQVQRCMTNAETVDDARVDLQITAQ